MNPYKILLIIPRYRLTNKKDYLYTFPVGMAYISSVLKKAGYEVDCLNLNHHEGPIRSIIAGFLNKKNYDFVGTGNNALGYNITKIILGSVKEHPSKPKTILGGPIITTQPELYFRDLEPDFGILGEGEDTITELLEALAKKKDIKNVKGIIYRRGKDIITTGKREPIGNLDSLPFPDFEGFGFSQYLDNLRTNIFHNYNPFDYPRTYPILGSRSCPFNCTFCYHDSRYRERSIDNIIQELELAVKKYKINIIIIYDDCFAVNPDRIKDFCKKIKVLQEKVGWKFKWSPQLTAKNVTPELLELMKDAGCDTVSYGFESYSPEVLKSMRKPVTSEQINCAFKETLKAGLPIQANFIFGDRAETKETYKETLRYWKNNAQGQIFLDFIQPYPGSEIYKHCVKKGIIKNELEFIKNFSPANILNMTDSMSNKEFNVLIKEVIDASSKYSKFVKPLSLKKISENNYSVGVKCPFCSQAIEYKNCYIENKYSYSFNLVCRNCHMRFFVASPFRFFANRYHSKLHTLRAIQLKSAGYLKKAAFIFTNKLDFS